MQIAGKFDTVTLKKIGISLLKTLAAAILVWLSSSVDEIGTAIKDPSTAVIVTLVVRSLITVGDEWRKGQEET